MQEPNFKDRLTEEENDMVKDTVSSLIDSLVMLNREQFTASDVRDLVYECEWAGKILFSVLFVNGELFECDCDDEDEDLI